MGSRELWLLRLGVISAIIVLVVYIAFQESENAKQTSKDDIKGAISQYAYRWDGKDSRGFADLFTANGVMERWILGERQSRLEGQRSILEYALASHQGRLADRQTRHHMSSVVFIEVSTETATTENMVLITHQTAADRTPKNVSSGVYRMTWSKTEGGWKIAKRRLVADRLPVEGSNQVLRPTE